MKTMATLWLKGILREPELHFVHFSQFELNLIGSETRALFIPKG